MRKTFAVLVAGVALLAIPIVAAADHVVSQDAVQQRLSEAAALRQDNLRAVDGALASPLAAGAAASVGADLDALRAAVPTLSDGELQDLAARAAALQADPVAGMDQDIKLLLMILLIVAIVVILVGR